MAPPGVLNTPIETGLAAVPIMLIVAVLILLRRGTAAQICHMHCLDVDYVGLWHQGERGLTVEVAALPAHMLTLLRALLGSLGAAVTPRLAPRDSLAGLLQFAFRICGSGAGSLLSR